MALALFLVASPVFSETPASQAGVDAMLYRMFVAPVPSLLDGNPARLTRKDLEAQGISSYQIQIGLEKLKRRYPWLEARIKEGREFREKTRTEADEASSKLLEGTTDLREPTLAVKSLAAFLKQQVRQKPRPPTRQKIEDEARNATVARFPNPDWKNDDVVEFHQVAEHRASLGEEVRRANNVDAEKFRAWHAAESAQLAQRMVDTYVKSLRIAVDAGVELRLGKQKLTRADVDSLGFTLNEGSSDITVHRRGETKELKIDVKPTSKIFAVEGLDGKNPAAGDYQSASVVYPSNAENGALRRLSELRNALAEQRSLLERTKTMDPDDAPFLHQSLARISSRHRSSSDTRSLFESKGDAEFKGADFHDLTYAGHASRSLLDWWYTPLWGKNRGIRDYWGRVSEQAHLNPLAKSLRFTASNQHLRPGFGKTFIPYLLGTYALLSSGYLANEAGLLEKPKAEVHRVTDVVSTVAVELAQAWAPRPEFTPDEGETIGISPTGENEKKKAFTLEGPNVAARPGDFTLDIANYSEMMPSQRLELLNLPSGSNQSSSVISGKVHVTDGRVALPMRRDGFHVTEVAITVNGKPEKFTLLKTDQGLPVAVLENPYSSALAEVQVGFAPGVELPGMEHLLSPESLARALPDLKDAGINDIARELEKEIEAAKKEKRFIFAQRVAEIVRENSLYTYEPSTQPEIGGESNPLRRISPYRDENGKTCIQCNQARAIVFEALKHHSSDEKGTRIRSANVFNPEKLTPGDLDHVQYTLGGYHAVVQLVEPDGTVEHIDGTPSNRDPRAPKPRTSMDALSRLTELWSPPAKKDNTEAKKSESPPEGESHAAKKKSPYKRPDPYTRENEEATPKPEEKKAAAETRTEAEKKTEGEMKSHSAENPATPPPSKHNPASPAQPLAPEEPGFQGDIFSGNAILIRRPVKPLVDQPLVGGDPPEPLDPTEAWVWLKRPNTAAVEAMRKAYREMMADPHAKEFANSGDTTTPVALAGRLLNALAAYTRGEIDIAQLGKAMAAINRQNPAFRLTSQSQIPAAIEAYGAELKTRISRGVALLDRKRSLEYEGLRRSGFVEKILAVTQHGKEGWAELETAFDYVHPASPMALDPCAIHLGDLSRTSKRASAKID